MTRPSWDLLTMIDFTSSRVTSRTPTDTFDNGRRWHKAPLSWLFAPHLPLCCLAIASCEKILPPSPHLLTAQSPSTTPSALRKVPYKGVGNIALVLHHHNKKKERKKKHPVRIQNLDGSSSFSSACLNVLTHQPRRGIWRIFFSFSFFFE